MKYFSIEKSSTLEMCILNPPQSAAAHQRDLARTISPQKNGLKMASTAVGYYIWYSEEGTGARARAPPSPLLTVPTVTAHPSMPSVPNSYYLMWHYNCLWTLKG